MKKSDTKGTSQKGKAWREIGESKEERQLLLYYKFIIYNNKVLSTKSE